MTSETVAPAAAQATQDTVIDLLGSIIARSRYEAWDMHASTLSWDEFRAQQPLVASNIYLADGRRDAEALLPIVQGAINRGAVQVLTAAGAKLAAMENTSGAAVVLAEAERIDHRSPLTKEDAPCGS